MKPAIFLDRDGTLIETNIVSDKPIAIAEVSKIRFLEGVHEGIKILSQLRFELVIVTNQPDVSRGIANRNAVDQINTIISTELHIPNTYVCFHDDTHNCECRKPKTGLIDLANRDLNLDLKRSYVIGDRWRDVELGQNAGCKSIFIDRKYAEKRPQGAYTSVMSLLEAALYIKGKTIDE